MELGIPAEHHEAIVVPENVDCVRYWQDGNPEGDASIKATDRPWASLPAFYLQLPVPRTGNRPTSVEPPGVETVLLGELNSVGVGFEGA